MPSKYQLSSEMERIIHLSPTIRERYNPSLSDDDIARINESQLPKRGCQRRLYYKKERNISSTTYVIPVSNGAITGYLYQGKNDSANLKPLIVFLHGGGWIFANMELYGLYCGHLAQMTGADVLLFDYRLAPSYKFPTALEDCYDAYIWAVQGAKYWKTDPDRIFLLGDSIGGTLCTVLSMLLRDRKQQMPAGQILLYPFTDGRLRTESYEKYSDSPTLTTKQMQFFMDKYAREPKDILSPLFSPLLSQDLSRLPDTVVLTAEYDPLKDDGKLFADALLDAGTTSICFEVKATVHGYMHYPKAVGSKETDCVIRQAVSGRPCQKIQFMTERELKRYIKQKMAEAQTKYAEKREPEATSED